MTTKNNEPVVFSQEAERAVLGAILMSNGDLYPAAAAELVPEDFALDSNRVIFGAMGKMQGPIDLVLLMQALLNTGDLERIGGVTYLSSITDGLPWLENLDHYADVVKTGARGRALIQLAGKMSGRAWDHQDPSEIVEDAQDSLRSIAAAGAKGGLLRVDDVYQKNFESVDDIYARPGGNKGLATGFDHFDSLTCGLQQGDLIVIAARPSVGKTALALDIARYSALKNELPVAVFSLEMSAKALMMRMLCAQGGVDSHRVRAGFCSHGEKSKLAIALADLLAAPLWIDDGPNHTAEKIYATARRLQDREPRLALLIVDYLQLMRGPKRENRNQEIAAISRGLKEAAKNLNIPIIALSQLSRASEDHAGPPKLSDLRESGQIEQDADVVAFLWKEPASNSKAHPSRKEESAPEVRSNIEPVKLLIEKQRNGPTGVVRLMFNKPHCRFYEEERETTAEAQDRLSGESWS